MILLPRVLGFSFKSVLNFSCKSSTFRRKLLNKGSNSSLITQSFPSLLLSNVICQRCMAGHSKWQNIRFIKAEKDREKSILASKYVRLIGFAVKENGANPKNNLKLASLIEEARKHNIAKDTIENAMKIDKGKKIKSGTLEILAPGGCIVIVEYETGNESIARYDMKSICKKHGASIMSGEGRWRACYEKKGIITVTKVLSGEELNEEKALDSAIEAGAEEVHMKENVEGKNYLEFVCAPDDIHPVKKEIEKLYDVEEYYVAYVPTSTVELSKEDMDAIDLFLEEMGSNTDVVRIYENVK